MIIRGLIEEDLPTRVQWMNDPRVYGSMHFDVPILLENTINWYNNNIGNNKRVDVVFEVDKQLVAMGGLTNINHITQMAELYIFVNPNLQRGGIGTQATKLLCKMGFDMCNLEKIYLLTNENNNSARKVYEKCGFSLEGRLRKEFVTNDGLRLDRLYYGLIKGELNE